MTDVRHCISCRMVTAVKDAAGTAPVERTDAGAVRALVDVIKKEETAVVVNLDERIQACIQLFHGNAHVLPLQFLSGDDIAGHASIMLSRGRAVEQAGDEQSQSHKG